MGLNLRNPIIVGSSGLTDSVEKIKEIEEFGAGAVVLKSLFEEEIQMEYDFDVKKAIKEGAYNPDYYDYYDYKLKEQNVKKYIDLIKGAKKAVNIPVIASVNCVSSFEWPFFAKQFVDAGADGLELNVFLMPSDIERSVEQTEEIYFKIIESVKDLSIPVSLKISYYFTNLAQMIKKLSETNIKGLVLFNRFYSPDFDIETQTVKATNVFSTPQELPISLRWAAMMSDKVSCDIAASTGVHGGEALIKQLLAGANAVQIVSTIYNKGNEVIKEMLSQLDSWMERNNYQSIEEFRGNLSQKSVENPALFERVQFMRYFSDREE